MRLQDIEIVEDRTDQSTCRSGFLQLRRLQLRNHYEDGTSSVVYPCDIVSRPYADAMAVCLYHRTADRDVLVVLKEGIRPPIYLRKLERFVVPDPRPYAAILEIVAGLIEEGDAGDDPLGQTAAREAREEVGFDVPSEGVRILGGESFASPGTGDEKVYFGAVEVPSIHGGVVEGDGTPMEETSRPVVLPLKEAITQCRDGRIPDLKTEVALLRLAEVVGYIPALDLFIDELPKEFAARYQPLGLT